MFSGTVSTERMAEIFSWPQMSVSINEMPELQFIYMRSHKNYPSLHVYYFSTVVDISSDDRHPHCKFLCWYQEFLCPVEPLLRNDKHIMMQTLTEETQLLPGNSFELFRSMARANRGVGSSSPMIGKNYPVPPNVWFYQNNKQNSLDWRVFQRIQTWID